MEHLEVEEQEIEVEECELYISFSGSNNSCDSSTEITSKNDFLLKYLNAQNNYLQSI